MNDNSFQQSPILFLQLLLFTLLLSVAPRTKKILHRVVWTSGNNQIQQILKLIDEKGY